MAIPTDVQAALDRLNGGYNNGDYNAGTNPLGFSNGGHRINLYGLTADAALVGEWVEGRAAVIEAVVDQIETVAGISSDVTTVAARQAAVLTLAALDDEIAALGAISSAINTVASNAAGINTVSTNISAVAAVASNLVAILAAAGHAANALASANAAAGYAAATKQLTLYFAYSTSLTDANPGAGVFRLNNANPVLATAMYISVTEAEGGDVTDWLDSWDDSTNTGNRGTITLVAGDDPAVWAKFKVTGSNVSATGYRKISLGYIKHFGSLGPGQQFGFGFAATGDRGNNGEGAGTVTDGGAAVEGNFAAFSDVTGTAITDSGKGPASFVERSANGSDFADAHAALDNLTKFGVNIASAATLDLDAATGIALTITGTTATSAITLGAGKWRLVRAAAAWPLTVGANLVLNNAGANYTCAAGDRILFVSEGTTVRGIVFATNGLPLQAVPNSKLATMATGQLKGRASAGAGAVEDLTAAQARTLLNVADGATANAAASQSEALAGADNAKFMTPLRTAQVLSELNMTVSLLAMQVADNANTALFLGSDGNRIADSFDTLTYVDLTYSTNLDTSTAGTLKASKTVGARIATGTGSATEVNDNNLATSIAPPLNDLTAASVASRVLATINFGSPVPIARISATASYPGGLSGASVWYGNDGSNWTQLGSNFGLTGSSATYTRDGLITAKFIAFVVPAASYSGTAITLYDLSAYAQIPADMTVGSTLFAADVAPTKAKIVALIKENEAAVAGTDYAFETSRDSRANWATAGLTEKFSVPTGQRVVESGEFDFTGLPTGTVPCWQFKTLNNKDVELLAVNFYFV